ncbi:hypothetical protein PSEUDO8AS_10588 [Pseudomonas sp. 8AS]|nr:hypothetical protein PSEUDO8AS_10588 [Pseudomonas sp. 8AS]
MRQIKRNGLYQQILGRWQHEQTAE